MVDAKQGGVGDEADRAGISRRSFLKGMAALGFAVPVISSFALDAAASSEQPHSSLPNQSPSTIPYDQYYGNQTLQFTTFANQSLPNQYNPVDGVSGQYYPNQYFLPNQFFGNQG